ncbi:MAG: adenylate/guanylate cyclase domain-containing protein [Acidimicrobiia bacterium]
MTTPTTRYCKSEDVHVAYQEFGDGPVNIVFVPGFVSHIDNYWTHPNVVRWLDRLGSFARVVMFDKRGTGLSDRVAELPAVDQRMDDVRAVLDAVGWERAAVFGISEGGSLAALFAAHHPDRTEALIVYGGFAKFTSWFPTEESLEALFSYIDTGWGTGESLPLFAPTSEGDVAFQEWWGRFERLGADPGAAITLMEMNSQIDITEILPSIHVPTLIIHRTEDTTIDFDAGLLLAERIPNAQLVELPGPDHLPWVGDSPLRIIDEIEQFLTGAKSEPQADRVLATILFTDIVDSTTLAGQMGDQRWRNLMHAHDDVVATELERFRGVVVKGTGDGVLATFDAPARAIRCALSIAEAVKPLGIEVRAGLHTGEIHLVSGDVEGISVNIASRVADIGGANEVIISRTVKDLIAGSGITLEPHGTYALKGIPDEWELYRAGA